jgi:hypothetical protein
MDVSEFISRQIKKKLLNDPKSDCHLVVCQ